MSFSVATVTLVSAGCFAVGALGRRAIACEVAVAIAHMTFAIVLPFALASFVAERVQMLLIVIVLLAPLRGFGR